MKKISNQAFLRIILLLLLLIVVIWLVYIFTVPCFDCEGPDQAIIRCKEAAWSCNVSLEQHPDDECSLCNYGCLYLNGAEIFDGAINCCKLGKSELIYRGSPGCH